MCIRKNSFINFVILKIKTKIWDISYQNFMQFLKANFIMLFYFLIENI